MENISISIGDILPENCRARYASISVELGRRRISHSEERVHGGADSLCAEEGRDQYAG